jgi:hypothetical protein
MIDSFPYDSWLNADGSLNTDITTFWTFGPSYGAAGGNLTGTYVLTVLGILLMIGALVAWVVTENRRLNEHADRLRAGMQ